MYFNETTCWTFFNIGKYIYLNEKACILTGLVVSTH
jgi:hypothetical protein